MSGQLQVVWLAFQLPPTCMYPNNITERENPPKYYFEDMKTNSSDFLIQGVPEASGQGSKVEIVIAGAPAAGMLTLSCDSLERGHSYYTMKGARMHPCQRLSKPPFVCLRLAWFPGPEDHFLFFYQDPWAGLSRILLLCCVARPSVVSPWLPCLLLPAPAPVWVIF